MRKLRKVIALLLILFASIFVVSCNNNGVNDDSNSDINVGEWFE